MKSVRIVYDVYFSNNQVQVKGNSPCHSLLREFVVKDKKHFVKERFEFEKKVHDFVLTLRSLYKMVSVDKTIKYFDLDIIEI